MFWKKSGSHPFSSNSSATAVRWICTDLTYEFPPTSSASSSPSSASSSWWLSQPCTAKLGTQHSSPTSQELYREHCNSGRYPPPLPQNGNIKQPHPFRPTKPLAFLASSSQLCHFQVQILHRNPALHLQPWLKLVVATVQKPLEATEYHLHVINTSTAYYNDKLLHMY